ncbi:helix-turn-helix domain-containing protein [Sorangium sp. So ce834]|uniref:helix-turn-helix domain-containing protein n=1 Tax=Sorangium sp. So ce834 TaxID=3133321 RepID=UPI003F5D8639
MNASKAIEERVDSFVKEILRLVRRVQEEHRAAARRTVKAMLTDPGRPAANASSERRPKRRKAPAQRQKSVAGPARSRKHGTRSAAPSASATAAPATKSIVAPATKSIVAPASGADRTTAGMMAATGASTSEREAVVLETVRSLVRGTATEIATRSGLPNGSVYVALRALMARGRVARAETARGFEYSLVSPGEIRPFKRVRAARPASPAEMEPTADAALAD